MVLLLYTAVNQMSRSSRMSLHRTRRYVVGDVNLPARVDEVLD